jgi:very-short-patch-repair endonuclease
MSEPISPDSHEVMRLTRGLMSLLRELVNRSRKQVRDSIDDGLVCWLAGAGEGEGSSDPRVLIEIEYQPPPDPPVPPSSVQPWLNKEDWSNADNTTPTLVDHAGHVVGDGEVPDEVADAYRPWLRQWQVWADEDRERAPRRERYETLERLARTASQRSDTHEVVCGVGLVTVGNESGWSIRRHLLVWDVSIVRDETTDVLQVKLPVTVQARLEDRAFLETRDGYRQRPQSSWTDSDLSGLHPFSEQTVAALERWRQRSWDGPLSVDLEHTSPQRHHGGEVAELSLAPAVFLRQRDRSGLAVYYETIAAALNQPNAVSPLGLAQLVVPLEPHERLRWLTETATRDLPVIGADPLFPLPTNREQRRVLGKLRADTGVVVQGPPGTGKTHTIANLICALLADGQRVLITSQKDQALRVLRDQLPKEVRQLCVLMTGMQQSGADELDRSITALSDLAATADADQLERAIGRLTEQRRDLLADLRRATRDLQNTREQEYSTHPAAGPGYSGTLADVVRAVNADRERHCWIGLLPERAGGEPPLTNEEARELLELLTTATPERSTRGREEIPPPSMVPETRIVADAIAAITDAERVLGSAGAAAAWSLPRLDGTLLGDLERHVDAAADALAWSGLSETTADWDSSDWRLAAAEALVGRRNPAYWTTLFDDITEVYGQLAALATLDGVGIEVDAVSGGSTATLTRLLGQARRLRTYLSSGGRLRRWWPASAQVHATELLENCRIDGAPPGTVNDLSKVIVFLRAEIAVATALEAWAAHGVPVAPGPMRRRIAQVKDIATSVGALRKVVAARGAIEHALRQHGIRYAIRSLADWDLVVRIARAGQTMVRAQPAAEALARYAETSSEWMMREGAPPEIALLATALRERDVIGYAVARTALDRARQDKQAQQRCDLLATRLASAHPVLAERVSASVSDTAWQARFGDFERAWSWAWAAGYHQQARDPVGERVHEQRITEIEQRIGATTAELAGRRALLHGLTRMTEKQKRALQAYKTAMGNYGRGQGTHKDRHLSAARDAMREAIGAVPAWVMPLATVADTIPPEPNAFDVVIVDEASQAAIDSVFLLWLAPRIIVVGDDTQCAPGYNSPHGLGSIQDLIDGHLDGMSLHLRNGFSPTSNLYELLSMHFPEVVRLSEHFRSMPEIIGWSSAQFYDNRLVPLRQFGADRLDPLQVVQVDGAREDGRDATLRNPVEAEAIVDQVRKMIDDPLYRGKTIGIIALQNCKQAQLLERLVNERIDPADIRRFDIRVGNPPDFQGDQRDVVLLSMVVTKVKRALTSRPEQRRYNVAASRARDQMWLFVSAPPDSFRTGGLRQSLLIYMRNPPATLVTDPTLDGVPHDVLRPPFESLLEQQIFLEIRRRGYAALPQYPIDDRRIDLVIVGDSGRLAVECDTPALRTSVEQLERDLLQERELRRAGWQFVRIRESEYQFDPAAALEPLWQQLDQRGIEPRSLPAAPRSHIRWTPTTLSDDEDDA